MKKLILTITAILLLAPSALATTGEFQIYPTYKHQNNSSWIIDKIQIGTTKKDYITIENLTNKTITLNLEIKPDLSADFLGNYTVIWERPTYDGSQNLTNKDIEGQSFKTDGKRIGTNFQINTIHTSNYQTQPSISMNEQGQYNVTFTENAQDIYIKNYNTEIFKIGTENKQNSSTTGTQSKANTAIAPNSNTATVWKDDNDNSIKFTLKDSTDTVIAQDQTVVTSATADNPQIAFYKDESGSNANKFIITWQASNGTDTDIYYRTYTATGTPEINATVVNTPTTNNQTHPVIDTGYSPYFTIGWLDDTDKIESAFYNGTSFLQTTIETCSSSDPCTNLNIAQEPTNNYIVFTWNQGTTSKSGYLQEANYTTTYQTIGNKFFIENLDYNIDVTFITNTQFIVSYEGAICQRYNFNTSQAPTSSVDGEIDPIPFPTTNKTNITANLNSGNFLITWEENNQIKGVFFKYNDATTVPTQYGPVFTINSTAPTNQIEPTASLNTEGRAIVAWEGNISQPTESPTITDTYAIPYQLLQSPLTTSSTNDLTPSISQDITTGVFTLQAPSTINFQSTQVSVTDEQTQTISIRAPNDETCGNTCGAGQDQPCACGGDPIKYLEITDERGGQEFNLTVTATNFISQEDQKSYIPNTNLKIRNWDQNISDTTQSETCSTEAPLTCFKTVSSSLGENDTTATLSSDTETYKSLDQSRTLFTKPATDPNNPVEIGKWRIYPEFQLTIPPIIPTGNHTATITFTLN